MGKEGKKSMAMKKLAGVDPERLKYEILFTATDVVGADQLASARRFVEDR